MGNAKPIVFTIREAYGAVRGRPGLELFSNRAPEGVPKRPDIDSVMIVLIVALRWAGPAFWSNLIASLKTNKTPTKIACSIQKSGLSFVA